MPKLLDLDVDALHLPKARFLMASWGLLILLAGGIPQFFDLPNPDFVLLLWGGVTLLGFLGQTACLVRGLQQNFSAWLIVTVLGWLFTFYVIKFDNGQHVDLFGDLAGVWLILLGLGYLATSYHVNRRFLILAALHLGSGALLELSARRVLPISFID